ncbi:right-handed parallel beta-helix repeat-containing protein [Flavobacterium psychrotolerans]|nr:right-handed parallel beta-helix repeat-containing protein [Flavobacterium psychrotolerans]
MEKLLLGLFLSCAGMIAVQGQTNGTSEILLPHNEIHLSTLESKIQEADAYWKKNKLDQAIQHYRMIIDKENIPAAYQSLVYLRLAEAQFEMNLKDDCRLTLSKIKMLAVIPAHHKLKVEELERKLDGLLINQKTSIPFYKKTVATFYVNSNPDSVNKIEMHGQTFNSIEKALDAARLLQKKTNLPQGTIEIVIEGATYSLDTSIRLNSENTGTPQNPYIIRSASSSKKVLVSGGKTLKYWHKETNPVILSRLPETSRNKVWYADLKENNINSIDSLVFGGFSSKRAEGGNSSFKTFPVPELFYEGSPQRMARWPNTHDTIVSLNEFKDARTTKWALDKDVWLHGYWKYLWADAYEKLKSVSPKNFLIELQPPFNQYGFGKSKWHVVNALSELDSPGEWYVSVEDKKIWYFPNTNFKPENCTLSLTGPAFQVENCDYLTIKDLDFRYIRGDGLVFTNCSNLTLANCSVKDASGTGIKIEGGNSHLVHSCTIESMGRGGIYVQAGDMQTLVSSGSIIENCKISDLSRIDRTYTPAILLEGVGIKVRNCLFSDIPSSAIRLEGNEMLIEMNEFTKCVMESDDQGAIDVYGNPLYRGNVIRWNFFRDIGIPNLHMVSGIRLDDSICGFGIYENLFLRSSHNQFGGIQIHGGKDNFIEGNIFADCHAAISQTAWGDEAWQKTLKLVNRPMYKAMHAFDWQSELWQTRYPDLKNLLIDSDRNYANDNQAINSKSLILRKSYKFQSFNDIILKRRSEITTISDYKKFLLPWHQIPFDKIGIYDAQFRSK